MKTDICGRPHIKWYMHTFLWVISVVWAFTNFEACIRSHTAITCERMEGYHLHRARNRSPKNTEKSSNKRVTKQVGTATIFIFNYDNPNCFYLFYFIIFLIIMKRMNNSRWINESCFNWNKTDILATKN